MAIAQHHSANPDVEYGIAPRLLLASVALGAGAIHLAMAPIHAPSSTTEAIGFAAVGWLQVLLAIGVMVRPSRALLTGGVLLSAAVLVTYLVSRTAGLPWGAHAGEAETFGGADAMTAIFEGVFITGAAVLLVRPSLGMGRLGESHFSPESIAMASAIPLVVLFVTSVALSDPELVQHGHDNGGGLVSADGHHDGSGATDAQLVSLASNRCDLGFNPAAHWNETAIAGIDTLMGGAQAMNNDAAGRIQGSPALDKLISTQTTSEGRDRRRDHGDGIEQSLGRCVPRVAALDRALGRRRARSRNQRGSARRQQRHGRAYRSAVVDGVDGPGRVRQAR